MIVRRFTANTIETPFEAKMELNKLLSKIAATITSVRRIIARFVADEVPAGARAAVKANLRQQTSALLVPLCNNVDRLRNGVAYPQQLDFTMVEVRITELNQLINLSPDF